MEREIKQWWKQWMLQSSGEGLCSSSLYPTGCAVESFPRGGQRHNAVVRFTLDILSVLPMGIDAIHHSSSPLIA